MSDMPQTAIKFVDNYSPQQINGEFTPYATNDNDSCPVFDELVRFNQLWSPRSAKLYHKAAVIHMLSTIAAKRLYVPLGTDGLHTDFYILIFGPSGLYAKSEALKPGTKILRALGLEFLRLPPKMSPEAMFDELSPIPKLEIMSIDNLEERERVENESKFSSQRSWIFNEMGTYFESILRESGYMGEFRGILREVSDYAPLGFRTRSHGKQIIPDPQITLIGNATPMDFKRIKKHLDTIFGDGLLARFMVATPNEPHNNKKFPKMEFQVNSQILEILKNWHNSLGIPEYKEKAQIIPKVQLSLPEAVYNEFYNYDCFLRDLIPTLPENIQPNYVRTAKRALQLACLFSSLNGRSDVGMAEFQKGVSITEEFRYSYHLFFDTVTNNEVESEEKKIIDYIIAGLEKHGAMGFGKLTNRLKRLKKMNPLELEDLLKRMEQAGLIAISLGKNETAIYGVLDDD